MNHRRQLMTAAAFVPAKGGPVSLFIDIIGMPLTPVSVAGVARRTAYRRVVWRR